MWPAAAKFQFDVTGEGQVSAPRMKILLVDDTPDNLVSLSAALSLLDEELVLAQSGKEALRHLLNEDFAAILLDVRMPEMDGFETAELIRKRPRSSQTPIIFLTGYKSEEYLYRGYHLGAVDYLFKPIVPEVLRSKVAVFVELARSSAKLREQAEALKQQANVLMKAEQKFRSLLDAAPDAMVVCREDGEVIMVNSQTEEVFGCGRDFLLGRNIRELAPNWEYLAPAAADLKLQPGEIGKEMHAVREDGSTFPVAISVRPLQTEEGVVVTTAIRDISVSKRNETLIQELNATLEQRVLERTQALQRSNEELQQFAYIASHDLQEPLRTISIFSELLARRCGEELDVEARQHLEYVRSSSHRMERLIHDLLDFAQLETRGPEAFSRIRSEEALADALRNLQVLTADHEARITAGLLPEVNGDLVQLTRLFQNLVANSIRFRSAEPPQIKISAERRNGEWVFSISDNGIGIEPQYAEKIFGIFKFLHPRDQHSGNGMGLAICRKIVATHGGRIWVESNLGKGATFYFTLAAR